MPVCDFSPEWLTWWEWDTVVFTGHLPTVWDTVKHNLLQIPVTCDWPSGGKGAWEQPGCGHLCVFLFHMMWPLWDMLAFSRQRKYCMVSWRIPFFVSLIYMKSILLNFDFHIGVRLSNLWYVTSRYSPPLYKNKIVFLENENMPSEVKLAQSSRDSLE